MVIDKEVAAADAAVGDNIVSGHVQERVGYNRFLVACGLSGSTAVGDTIISVKVGGKEVDVIRNQETGLAITSSLMLATRAFVKSNTLVEAEVVDAANSNPIRVRLVFVP